MKVRILKVFGGHDLRPSEIRLAADAAARTFPGKRFALPVVDSLFGLGFEILLVGDELHEVEGNYSLNELPTEGHAES